RVPFERSVRFRSIRRHSKGRGLERVDARLTRVHDLCSRDDGDAVGRELERGTADLDRHGGEEQPVLTARGERYPRWFGPDVEGEADGAAIQTEPSGRFVELAAQSGQIPGRQVEVLAAEPYEPAMPLEEGPMRLPV